VPVPGRGRPADRPHKTHTCPLATADVPIPSRRDALRLVGASLAAGLGGCVLTPDDGPATDRPTTARPPATTATTRTATRTSPPERSPTATVVPLSTTPFADLRVESTPDDVPFEHDVVPVRAATADHPPRLRLSVRNVADGERTLSVPVQRLPLTPAVATDGDATLTATYLQDGSRREGCWTLAAGNLGRESMPDRASLAPGEAVVGARDVFADPANPTCWPAGEYRFGQRYEWGIDDPDRGYEWGFTVVVA
jgi:hypothetical protein